MSFDQDPNRLQEVGAEPETPGALADLNANASEAREAASLLEGMESLSPSPLVPGQVVQGRVLAITDNEVLVDIGLKSEAAVPRGEFLTAEGQLTAAPNDLVDLWIEQFDEMTGTVIVSHQKAVRQRIWDEIERAFQDQTFLRGRVVDRIKGGLTVDIGVPAFLPASHADTRPHANLDALKDQEITCKVVKVNRKRDNVVVSRKAALEDEQQRRKAELLERLVEGAELVGTVKNLTDYGAFVDLGGMDGLLHVTDMSWGRVKHPSELVQAGQVVKVKVLRHDPEKGRVSLGLKQLTPDPWERVPETFHAGDRVTGRVVSLTDYGAFVELAEGVEGLIHISEMSWSRRLHHPSKLLNLGDRVEVGILEVSLPKRRISLSLRATLPDPWASVEERFTVGSVVQGRVRNLTDFGAFVEIEDGLDGLIHLSNMSWNKDVRHPSEVLKNGQKVEAIVLAVEAATHRLSLGMKQLEQDPWEDFCNKTRVGELVRGKVSRLSSFGAFVELQEGIEGLCHVSEFDDDHRKGEDAKLEVGSEYEFRIIRMNPADRKIGLSMRDPTPVQAPSEAAKAKEPARNSTMADALSLAGITPTES
jgi:small subunit ribosomal protein S1